MKTVTYLRAYLLNSTSAKVELALKNDAKNIRLQGELIKKLEKVNNSNVRSDLERAQKYTDKLAELRAGKNALRPEVSSNKIHDVKRLELSTDLINSMSSPAQVVFEMNQLRGHLDAILACANFTAVNNQNEMRAVMTNLQYLSDYNTNDEDKKMACMFLQQSVADKKFCTFGNNNIDTDVQYDAVMAHLSTIKSWLDKKN